MPIWLTGVLMWCAAAIGAAIGWSLRPRDVSRPHEPPSERTNEVLARSQANVRTRGEDRRLRILREVKRQRSPVAGHIGPEQRSGAETA